MKTNTTTLINFILDMSGSMQSISQATVSSVNEYIQSLKADKKNNYLFGLTVFNSNVLKTIRKFSEIKDVKELKNYEYLPLGMTPLIDSVYNTLSSLEIELMKDKTKYAIITVVMTDGQENTSREHNGTQLARYVKKLEDKGNWTFVYMGANQDSWMVAKGIGATSVNNVKNWDASNAGTQSIMRDLSAQTVNFAQSTRDGVTLSSSNFFSMKTPSLKTVAQSLTSLHAGQYRLLDVQDTSRIDELIEHKLRRPYKRGEAYYQLMKPETIQAQKEVALFAKSKVYIGKEARQLLGLPDYEVKVKPKDFPDYEIFVQSTSNNRKLIDGTKLLVLS